MIAAVKVESSALDSMREKLKEVDNLRTQISAFNKRLIEADQANLSLKSALMKSQEVYSDIHKQKSEVESANVQLRQELNRAKDFLAKEKAARQTAQQEILNLREKVGRYEAMIENFERESKTIPVLQESNEILKSDLSSARRKFKEEKNQMVKHIRQLESQQSNSDFLKTEMRNMAMHLMDVANGTNSSAQPTGNSGNFNVMAGTVSRSMPARNSANNYNFGPPTGGDSVASAADLEEDDDDYEDDRSFVGEDSLLDEDSSIPDQASYHAFNSSTESVSKNSFRSTNAQGSRMVVTNQMQVQQPQVMLSNLHVNSQQDSMMKKRKKKAASVRQQGYAPNMTNNGGTLSLPRIN
jgi:hypothetical protein